MCFRLQRDEDIDDWKCDNKVNESPLIASLNKSECLTIKGKNYEMYLEGFACDITNLNINTH